MSTNCPACGLPVEQEHWYCERCGHDLNTAPPRQASSGYAVFAFQSSTVASVACAACGAPHTGAEECCEHCGQRRVAGADRTELELAGAAGVTDRGHHRRYNEDAFAIGRLDGDTGAAGDAGALTAAVVCDGVSSSARADAAAHAAVNAAIAALAGTLPNTGRPPGPAHADAIFGATEAAAAAVAALGAAESGHDPPSCTYVAAVVSATEVTVGWVGDSRAYWLAPVPADSLALTADDSLAGQLAAAGQPPVATAGADPRSLALLRWLGADATDTAPHLCTFTPTGPGRVLLCSDGLSRYLPRPADLATAVAATAEPLAAAKLLTQLALDAGGQDNIVVAILTFPPSPQAPEGPYQ